MIAIIAIYIFVGLVLTGETIQSMEAKYPDEMTDNYRNPLWWLGPILVTITWPAIFVEAMLEQSGETT